VNIVVGSDTAAAGPVTTQDEADDPLISLSCVTQYNRSRCNSAQRASAHKDSVLESLSHQDAAAEHTRLVNDTQVSYRLHMNE